MNIDLPVLNNVAAAEPHHRTYRVGVRRKTRQVNIGGILVGGNAPISVQTMTKTNTSDVD